MKVPQAELAVVDPAKVRDYLLSPEHPVGRFKATFFGEHRLLQGRLGSPGGELACDRRVRRCDAR